MLRIMVDHLIPAFIGIQMIVEQNHLFIVSNRKYLREKQRNTSTEQVTKHLIVFCTFNCILNLHMFRKMFCFVLFFSVKTYNEIRVTWFLLP